MSANSLARENLREPRFAVTKRLADFFAEQCQHANGLPGTRAQRTRKNFIRQDAHRTVGRELVDDHGLAAHLRHRQQLAMRACHELHISGALRARAQQRDALVGDDQRGGRATNMFDGLLQNAFELVRAITRRTIRGPVSQQQLEVAVAGGDGAVQRLDG